MEKTWCLTDTAGKFRAKHENQRQSKPNYVNTKVCNEATKGDYQIDGTYKLHGLQTPEHVIQLKK